MTYKNILIAVDGSKYSDYASQASISLALQHPNINLIACHAYAAKLHFDRFEAMEDGLPDQYQEEENLNYLQKTHDDLIGNGLELISDAYTKELCLFAQTQGIRCKNSCPEGKNFKEILKVINNESIDLCILGSSGQGNIGDNYLGSVAERVLLHAQSDVLIIKQKWDLNHKPIVIGIDGSMASYHALHTALDLATFYNSSVFAVAVYDPFFHSTVFKTIADVLPKEDQEKFNFTAQEKLHDEIIDKGLEKVYLDGLEKAKMIAQAKGIDIEIEVLEGKVYPQIAHYAELKNAGLIVMGRHGQHYTEPSLIGSNTHNLVRLTQRNILVTANPKGDIDIPKLQKKSIDVSWAEDAEQAINRIPEFVRSRAKWTIEEYARDKGVEIITIQHVNEVQQKIGMGAAKINTHDSHQADKSDVTLASKVVFRKTKKMAPDFHRHMVQEQIIGKIIQTGDTISVYTVKSTEPDGKVMVNEQTIIEFL